MVAGVRKRLKQDQGVAMIIAIFAMVFLFGVMVILFSTVLGGQGRTVNNLNQNEAAATAYAGEQRGVVDILSNKTDHISWYNSTANASVAKCSDSSGSSGSLIWNHLSR